MQDKQNTIAQDRMIRIAGFIWLVYIVMLTIVDNIFLRIGPRKPLAPFYLANGFTAIIFILLSYWKAAFSRLGRIYSLLFILLISIAPILMNHFIAPRLPPGPLSNAEGMAIRLFPVLTIGLILTAWQFRFVEVALYSLSIAFVELVVVFILVGERPQTLTLFTLLNIVRTASFLAVGFFITRLMAQVRQQQNDLHKANEQLRRNAETMEELAVSRERNRLARELHDTLAHSLTALSLQLETIKAYWSVDNEKARTMLDRALEITRSGTQETRRALKSLRASPLDDLGFTLAVRQMAQSAAERAHLELQLEIDPGLGEPPLEKQHALFRIAQEAVENVIKHARAAVLCVSLTQNKDVLNLTITDDGVGFNPDLDNETGYGLIGMRERARLAGAQLHVDSNHGKGTTVILEMKGDQDESDHL